MKTLEESRKRQRNAIVFWRIFLMISWFAVLSPALADKLISFDASMAAAFLGIVCVVISLVMIRVFNTRIKLIIDLSDPDSLMDAWDVEDRYHENQGRVQQAYFSKCGVFYAGRPYPLKSYECTIVDARIMDDEGPCLSITYTTPNSRMGSARSKRKLNIPIPDGKSDSATKLANVYANERMNRISGC